MEELFIEGTYKTLEVHCKNGLVEFSGRSILNDPNPFFKPVEQWVKTYESNPAEETVVNCRFEYIDTASFKHVYLILKELLKMEQTKVSVNWFVEQGDPEIQELGNILDNISGLKFNFISY